jgi:hypothetical protein
MIILLAVQRHGLHHELGPVLAAWDCRERAVSKERDNCTERIDIAGSSPRMIRKLPKARKYLASFYCGSFCLRIIDIHRK